MINKEQVKQGINLCLSNAITLARDSQLLTTKTDVSIAAGLYTFAIEEYGKALLLHDCLEYNSDKCLVPKKWFSGKQSHDIKFARALKELPKKCTSYVGEISLHYTDDSEGNLIPAGEDDEITNLWCGGADFVLDFKSRMDCFYVSWNDEMKNWSTRPELFASKLPEALTTFLDHVTKIKNSLLK